MKLINVEPKDNYIVRIFLDDDSIVDFDVKAELERIPCYKPLYDKSLFKTVSLKINVFIGAISLIFIWIKFWNGTRTIFKVMNIWRL